MFLLHGKRQALETWVSGFEDGGVEAVVILRAITLGWITYRASFWDGRGLTK